MKKTLNIVGYITVTCGALLILGTAGASDIGRLENIQIVTRLVAGLSLCGVGVLMTRVARALRRCSR